MMAPTRGQRRAVILLLLLSVVLITLDHRGEAFQGVRSAAHSVVDPAQAGSTTLVAPVGRFFGRLGDLGDSGRRSTRCRRRTPSCAGSCARASCRRTRSERAAEARAAVRAGRVHRAARGGDRARRRRSAFEWTVTVDAGRRDGVQPGPDRDRLRRAGRSGQAGRRRARAVVVLAVDPGSAVGVRVAGGNALGVAAGNGAGPADLHAAGPDDQGAGRRPPAHRPVRRVDVRGRAAGRRGHRGVRRPGRAGPGGDRRPRTCRSPASTWSGSCSPRRGPTRATGSAPPPTARRPTPEHTP